MISNNSDSNNDNSNHNNGDNSNNTNNSNHDTESSAAVSAERVRAFSHHPHPNHVQTAVHGRTTKLRHGCLYSGGTTCLTLLV